MHLVVLCNYLYHCVLHVLFLQTLNIHLIIFSKFNNILIQSIFGKNLNSIHKTFWPKKSNFKSASMFMLSSLSNDVSPAKKCVLILDKNDRRILFLIISSFQRLTPAKTAPFLHHINHQCVQSFRAPWFQTFVDRQISLPFCSPERFFSWV